MIDIKEFEMLNDQRVKTRIRNIAEMLEKKFAKMIEAHFHSNIGEFNSWWRKFGIYAKKAKSYDGKANGLDKEEAGDFAIMRKNFNKWLGVSRDEIRKLNTQFRYNGKVVRIPMELLDDTLRTYFNLKAINAGKNIKTNEHWTKKYIPDSNHFESVWKKHQKDVAAVEQPKVEQKVVEQPKVEATTNIMPVGKTETGLSAQEEKELDDLIEDMF